MPTVFDYTDLGQLTDFARLEVPTPSTFTLNQFLPDVTIDGIEVEVGTITRTNRTATFRAYDAETPIGKRDTFSTSRVKIPPIGQKLVIGEYERIMLEVARGASGTQLVDSIYDDTANNVGAIRSRVELARGDVLLDGKFTLAGENGLTIEYNAGVAGDHIVNTGTSWATVATSTPILDLRTWADKYTDDAGEPPAYALTSRKVISLLLRTAEIRTLVGSLSGAPGLVARTQLNDALNAHGLPQLVEYDSRVSVAGSSTRVLPDDKVILLPASGLGRTVWGITAEALELTGAGFLTLAQAPGITAVTMHDGDPVRVWTKATATCMPVIDDPTKILIADVIL